MIVVTDAESPPAIEEQEFEAAEWATAMVLMALQGGQPGAALVAANTLMRASGDPEFYDAVGDVILHVFPPDPS